MATMVRVDTEQYAKLKAKHEAGGETVTEQVRSAIRAYLRGGHPFPGGTPEAMQRMVDAVVKRAATRAITKRTTPVVVDQRSGLRPDHDPRCPCGLCRVARGEK